jgi:phage/plasmid-like protein (TIGR03299 family)
MSHEIENETRFYSYKEPAWHGLGYVSETAMSIDEALIAADMDFEWTKSIVSTTVIDEDDIETLDIPEKFAVVRRNRRNNERHAYGPVGERYTVHSANEIFSFVDELQGGGAVLETVGSLGGGEREFVVVKLPDSVTVGGNDKTNLYLTGTTAFDGSAATRFDLTGIRVVCANTWKFALRGNDARESGYVKFRHTSELDGSNIDKARRVLELSTAMAESMQELGQRLLGVSLRDEDAAQVVATLFPFPDHVKPGMDQDLLSTADKSAITRQSALRQKVFTLYKKSDVRAADSTAWGLFNAVTEYADHHSKVRGDDQEAARAEKVLLGGFDSLKEQALDLLLPA